MGRLADGFCELPIDCRFVLHRHAEKILESLHALRVDAALVDVVVPVHEIHDGTVPSTQRTACTSARSAPAPSTSLEPTRGFVRRHAGHSVWRQVVQHDNDRAQQACESGQKLLLRNVHYIYIIFY